MMLCRSVNARQLAGRVVDRVLQHSRIDLAIEQQDLEFGARCCMLGFDVGKGKALSHPVAVAGSGDLAGSDTLVIDGFGPGTVEVPAIDIVVEVAAPAPVAAAPAAEQLATTSGDDDAATEPIIVEHTIAAIPDPPDVGASDRRQSFEVEADPDVDDAWLGVRNCESHNNYAINTGNGFYGAYQFTISSWDWVAGLIGRPDLIGVRPDLAAPWDQDRLAQALAFEVAGGGLQHWPVCGRYYG